MSNISPCIGAGGAALERGGSAAADRLDDRAGPVAGGAVQVASPPRAAAVGAQVRGRVGRLRRRRVAGARVGARRVVAHALDVPARRGPHTRRAEGARTSRATRLAPLGCTKRSKAVV